MDGEKQYYEELARYGLIDAYQDGASGIRRAVELLDDPQTRSSRREIARQAISQMTDVTAFIVSTVQTCGRGEVV